jgi:hypothetical protein
MSRPTLLLALALLLGGCGADPSSLADVDGPVREALSYPTSGHGAPDQDALDRLMAMERAHKALAGASYTARVYSRGTFGGKKPADVPWAGNGEWEGRTTWEATYVRPEAYRFVAKESTDHDRVGLRVLLAKGGATVRLPGLRGLVARKRDLQHEDLLDYRGHSLAALTPAATVTRLAGAATARIAGETRLDGVVLDLVEIPRTPAFDPEVAREVVGIERGTGHLRLHAMYAADGRKVYEQQVLGLRKDAAPAPLAL